MKHGKRMTWIAVPVLAAAMGLPVLARQENRPPPPDQNGGGPDARDGGRDGGRDGDANGFPGGRGDRRDRGGDRGGPDGSDHGDHGDHQGGPNGGGGGPRRPPENAQLERMRGYLDLVDRFAKLSRDSTATGVAAVVSAGDVLKARGPEATIEFFNKMLPQVKDPSVQRAIRLQLVDLYRASNQQEKAMDQLTQLLTGAAPGAGPGAAPGPTPDAPASR